MEKRKTLGWISKLLFGKFCLIPGYRGHAEFFQETARFSQSREDQFVEDEIERIAQEQYHFYLSERAKFNHLREQVKDPELKKMCEPIVLAIPFPHCYHIYDDLTAKFSAGRININERIQERYRELKLLSGHGPNGT